MWANAYAEREREMIRMAENSKSEGEKNRERAVQLLKERDAPKEKPDRTCKFEMPSSSSMCPDPFFTDSSSDVISNYSTNSDDSNLGFSDSETDSSGADCGVRRGLMDPSQARRLRDMKRYWKRKVKVRRKKGEKLTRDRKKSKEFKFKLGNVYAPTDDIKKHARSIEYLWVWGFQGFRMEN